MIGPLAPHPPPPNAFLMHTVEPHDEGFTHEELSLGYANRSAVLFQVRIIRFYEKLYLCLFLLWVQSFWSRNNRFGQVQFVLFGSKPF
jgi:hypothetical protein